MRAMLKARFWWELLCLTYLLGNRPRAIRLALWVSDRWTDAWYRTPEGELHQEIYGRFA